MRTYLAALVLCVSWGLAHADFNGEVVGVLDGDTLDVLVDKTPVRVRLAQIDAPEKAQPFGNKARQALATMVFRRVVLVRTSSVDRYGRAIGTVVLEGRDINRAMIEQGLAWVYRRYAHDASLASAEAEAKANQLGLWADSAPVPPWKWRNGDSRPRRPLDEGVVR